MLTRRILLSEQIHLHTPGFRAHRCNETLFRRLVLAIANNHAVGVRVLGVGRGRVRILREGVSASRVRVGIPAAGERASASGIGKAASGDSGVRVGIAS